MKFRLGIAGLCTSHPGNWIPVIKELDRENFCDVEITAMWDSGETRPAGFAADFAKSMGLENIALPETLEEMVPLVDGVIIHTANWARHLEQARPFIEAGAAVLLDKPVIGNMKDAATVLDWLKQGRRITGGSSLRYCNETAEVLACPESERGKIYTVYSAIGSDEFNYGVHGYSLLCGLMGPGAVSARYLGGGKFKQIMLNWEDGRSAFLTLAGPAGLPFNAAVVAEKKYFQFQVNTAEIYRSMLKKQLPYLTGQCPEAPETPDDFLTPELLALAARESWKKGGAEVFISDLHLDTEGYDGHLFAAAYRRSRMKPKQ